MFDRAWEILTLLRCIFHYFVFCRADIEDENALLSKNSTTATQDISQTRTKYLAIYGALVANTMLLAFSGAGFFLYVAICASQNLHNLMFERLLGATIYFFDHNPVGKVLSILCCTSYSCVNFFLYVFRKSVEPIFKRYRSDG